MCCYVENASLLNLESGKQCSRDFIFYVQRIVFVTNNGDGTMFVCSGVWIKPGFDFVQ